MRSLDRSIAREDIFLAGALSASDKQFWHCHTKVERYEGDIVYDVRGPGLLIPRSAEKGLLIKPYDTTEVEGNLLLTGGASIQWQTLIGNGTGTASQELTFFNNANAAIGVGDSNTAEATTQTELPGGHEPPA